MSTRADYSTTLSNGKILTCHLGDLTLLETDVIVNAANPTLLGGNGVDMAVHRRGGPIIREECQKIREIPEYLHGLPVGRAVITSGGNLKAKYVIHTVGPKYHHDPRPEERLRASYTNSLTLAEASELIVTPKPESVMLPEQNQAKWQELERKLENLYRFEQKKFTLGKDLKFQVDRDLKILIDDTVRQHIIARENEHLVKEIENLKGDIKANSYDLEQLSKQNVSLVEKIAEAEGALTLFQKIKEIMEVKGFISDKDFENLKK